MAGSIEVGPNIYWSAAGWLFHWVLNDLRASAQDPATATTLEEIVRENLPSLRVDELSDTGRAGLFDAICGSLIDHSDRKLPVDLPNREDVLRHLRELVALACGGYWIEMWVVATSEPLPSAAVKHWTRDEFLVHEPGTRLHGIWLGETDVVGPRARSWRGPAGRVFYLLARRGTAPMPMLRTLDSALEADLLSSFAVQPADPPFKVTDQSSFGRFLAENHGRYLFTHYELSEDQKAPTSPGG